MSVKEVRPRSRAASFAAGGFLTAVPLTIALAFMHSESARFMAGMAWACFLVCVVDFIAFKGGDQ